MKKNTALILGLLIAPLALAGCSSGGAGATVTVTRTVTAKAEATGAGTKADSSAAKSTQKATPKASKQTAATDGQTKGTTPFGATWTSKTGRKITVSKPVPYTPSSSAYIGQTIKGGHLYKITITLANPADQEAFDPSQLSFTATSGSTQVDGVTDIDANIGNEPSSTLLPGRSLTWSEAYPVVPGTHLSLEVTDYSTFSTLTIFDGKVR